MKHKYIYIFPFILALLCQSCSDWLDVRGENIKKEADQYDNYKGFRDALTGCYMQMASTDAYGERLTMTDIEDMADLWYNPDNNEKVKPTSYYLYHHDYDEDYARSAVKAFYSQLFTTIASANVLIKNVEEKGGNIGDVTKRDMILGEAYAIRAYCQFDVLRLFGPCPADSMTSTVKLPYSFTTSIKEMPEYHAFSDYVKLLDKDLFKADSLLKGSDPLFSNTIEVLNSPDVNVDDDFTYYRQSRLNYWAVKALEARESLYLGRKQKAHDLATEVINAKGADGNALISLSGVNDLAAGYHALPSECLFYLSKYDVNTYANKVLLGGNSGQVNSRMHYITTDMLQDLYSSLPGASASHNRYLEEWNRASKDARAITRPTIKKYWYDSNKTYSDNILTTKLQIIPMLRLSEMYITAMETSESLNEIQKLYKTYMSQCAFSLYTPFTSVTQAHQEMLNEWRREFFAEGQMFYTYKRLKATTIWNGGEVKPSIYVVPLPKTEYDPSTTSNQ